MKTNKIKEPLFSNRMNQYIDEDDFFEGIQMANFKTINHNPNYMKLQDENNQTDKLHIHNQNSNTKTNNDFKRVYANKPVVPNASYNFQPNKIFINGVTYIHRDAIKGTIKTTNKPKKPQMQVMCKTCFSQQMVPANTHAFVCFNCTLTQGCQPQYGLFICGHCEKKVWYPLGISQLIKCSKCGTINKVPNQQLNLNNNFRNHQNPYAQKNQQSISVQQFSSHSDEITQKYFSKNYPQL